MTGYCENCSKQNECHKDIGIIWGFCNSDFEPKSEEVKHEGGKKK